MEKAIQRQTIVLNFDSPESELRRRLVSVAVDTWGFTCHAFRVLGRAFFERTPADERIAEMRLKAAYYGQPF